MSRSLTRFCFRYRWPLAAFFIVFSLLWAGQIGKNRLDPDMMNQLPRSMESRMSNDKIEKIFGGTDMIMVLLRTDNILRPDTLKRVIRLSREMKKIRGIDKVWSLSELKSVKGRDGAMQVNPVLKNVPVDPGDLASLRRDIMDNDFVYGTVVSKNFTVTGIIGLLASGVSDDYILGEIDKLVHANPGAEETVIAGVPYNRINVAQNTRKDMARLLPIGLMIMIVFLYFCFGQLRGVVLPFLMVLMSIAFTMGVMPLLGWKISVVIILLPIILVAVANDYGIHMIARYQEELSKNPDISKRALVEALFRSLGKPVLLCGLTTVAGMLCLTGHILISAEQLGVLAAAGILFALIASLFFIAAILFLLPKGRVGKKRQNASSPVNRTLDFLGSVLVRRPGRVLAAFTTVLGITCLGIFLLKVDTDPMNYYPEEHPVVYSCNLAKNGLGGIFNITLNIKGDIMDPALLKKIDRLEKGIEKIDGVSSTSSIARLVRQMSRGINETHEDGYDRIPDSREAVAQYFELYAMSGAPEDFEKLVDFDCTNALINIRVNTTSTPELDRIITAVRKLHRDIPEVECMGGIGRIFTELAHHVVRGQILSLAMSLLVVAVLIMISFRSIQTGIILILPLAVSIPTLFGIMGLAGIQLDMVNSLLTSIMIGAGVDYSIHFFWRYKLERTLTDSPEQAVRTALSTTGRGILFNALSVIIGFIVLLSSNFMPVKFFGLLVVVSIFICLLGALMLIPALILTFRPRCLEGSEG